MISSTKLSKKKFAIYGLGKTGHSVINYLNKRKIRNIYSWDDEPKKRNSFSSKITKSNFPKILDNANYIVLSPGINFYKSNFRKALKKNRHKIITDLDLFYMENLRQKSVVVTGTNGKSTTCKLLEHLLKKNKINVQLGGNIGKPILSLNLKKKSTFIIEASSYQLAYSKFIKPNQALLLNISKDHLEWHKNFNNYLNSKMKIFSLQSKGDFAFLNNKKLIKKFRRKKYKGRLKIVSLKPYKKIKNSINNIYLQSKVNQENMSFVYMLSKIYKIKKNKFIKSFEGFKGLPHRYEVFFKKKNIQFINDSKATSFEASKFALENNKNIFWILGGLPKSGDIFKLKKTKKNIIRSFIIGKNIKYFKKQVQGKINFKLSKTLNNALKSISSEIKNYKKEKVTILFSPASASFDQFKNFEERGNKFKTLVKLYANKYF